MKKQKLSRRDILKSSLKGSTALALGTVFASVARAAAPPAEAITPQLIEAAKKEGKVVWYTSIDLSVSEKIAAAFREKFGGIEVRVERTGAERVFQRIGQEYASNVHAVDVANSSDAAHLLAWKRQGILLPYVPEDVAKHYKPEHRDADGTFAGFRATLSPIAYNTKLVKAEDAPKSFADLLDPKWKGKIVKAHPGYSGTILTATFRNGPRHRLGVLRESRQAEHHAGAVGDRSAEETLARRAQRDGRRHRIQCPAAEGGRAAGGGGLSDRGHAVHRRAERHLQGGAESQRGQAVPELLLHRRRRSGS